MSTVRWLLAPRRRWWLLAGLWLALLIVGIGGFFQQSRDLGLGNSALDNLYLTWQLAALDYDGDSDAINWRLQIARFAAPVMAAGTVLTAASIVFRQQFVRWQARFQRDHIVVVGAGGVGSRLARAFAAAGRSVVVAESDVTRPGVGALREHEIPVVAGDPTDPAVLRAVRLDRAAECVVVGRTDAANAAVLTAVTAVAASRSTPLRVAVHLADVELVELVRGSGIGGGGMTRVEFFNLHAVAARSLLAEHPVVVEGDGTPHLVVMGLGQFGRSVVVAAAQREAVGQRRRLAVTLVDRLATGRWTALTSQHPAVTGAVDVHSLDFDVDAPTGDALATFTDLLGTHPPTLVVVAFEDESLALSSALFVRRLAPSARIVVRTDADSGFGAMVTRGPGGDGGERLHVFPFLERACTLDVVEGGVREQLARGLHEDHLARVRADATGGTAWRQGWEALTDAERESSRHAADGIIDSLAPLGLRVVPLARWGASESPFTADDVDRLAAAEHERWRAERTATGWAWGPERDDGRRHNPLLVPWPALDAGAQEHNRDTIRALPALLARAGLEIARPSPAPEV